MPQHYYPDRRIPYDVDGTRVLYRRQRYTTLPNIFTKELDWRELDAASLKYLNSSRRYALAFGELGKDVMNGGSPFYGAWEIAFVFPDPIDLSGVYLATTNQFTNAEYIPRMSVSDDTTALDDGTWSERIILPKGTYKEWSDTRETASGFYPTAEIDRFRVHRVDTGADLWVRTGMDVLGSYREQMPNYGEGIVTLYGSEYQSITALRLTMEGAEEYFGYRTNIHLYGTRSETEDDWGLDIVRADGDRLLTDDLVYGNLVQPPSGVIQYTTTAVRVRNHSATRTAEDVVFTLTEDEDQANSQTAGFRWGSIMNYSTARINGGPWQTSSDLNPITFAIGDLAPGETSDIIEIRLRSANLALFEWWFYGPGNQRLLLSAGGWS